jgi:MinD-like ATPase involved in chromosome partitioning or flagellar assembly
VTLDVAVAASARSWPDRFHRHVLDHGGARVVGRLMGPTQCLETEFDVILIDDVCSYLSPRLVNLLRQRGRAVVGVFDPVDSVDAKRRLLECGISDVIESDATPPELLERAAAAVHVLRPAMPPPTVERPTARTIGVIGVTDGVGATEVALSVAVSTALRTQTILIDLDPTWPSTAQRLDLAPYPNLRTLVDITLHRGDLAQALQSVGALSVVVGTVSEPSPTPIAPHEMRMAVEALAESSQLVIGDLGAESRVDRSLLAGFESVILVSGADPVGLSRMVRVRDRLTQTVERSHLLVVVNRVPQRRFYRAEIRSEISSVLAGNPLALLPFDPSIEGSAWDGRMVTRGHFIREIDRVAELVSKAVVG